MHAWCVFSCDVCMYSRRVASSRLQDRIRMDGLGRFGGDQGHALKRQWLCCTASCDEYKRAAATEHPWPATHCTAMCVQQEFEAWTAAPYILIIYMLLITTSAILLGAGCPIYGMPAPNPCALLLTGHTLVSGDLCGACSAFLCFAAAYFVLCCSTHFVLRSSTRHCALLDPADLTTLHPKTLKRPALAATCAPDLLLIMGDPLLTFSTL